VPLNDRQRVERLAAERVAYRAWQLDEKPVAGSFDATHLKEIHHRLFQDLPELGVPRFDPGQFRQAVDAPDRDWVKHRGLSTVAGTFTVVYSHMDAPAREQLDQLLERADPAVIASMQTTQVCDNLSRLYANLDYIHPFNDGNSRTLRTFTRQLAAEGGYQVAWEQFAQSPVERDRLYIARDLAVNSLAIRSLRDPDSEQLIALMRGQLDGNASLRDLVGQIVRPSRAIAFEEFSEKDALANHPELTPAYDAMRKHTIAAKTTWPDDVERQRNDIHLGRVAIQKALDAGVVDRVAQHLPPRDATPDKSRGRSR
jgi:cell filamentation protein